MDKAEKVLRSYFDIGEDLNAEHVQAFALTLHDMLLEFGEECFNTGREFNSKDGTVDINIVIFYKGADNSDLEPLYPTFNDYLNSLE